jgi:alkanesulfonate monooxygenase SsuD/methylene tetrahydromethanopterin reductase-like flavin-dependent oxidoreductase (luciferase family)
MTIVTIRWDFRTTPAGVGHDILYPAGLEQMRWADQIGLDAIVLSEHHVSADGYLPAPIAVGAAAAAVTERIPITIAALIVPLHHPVRLAEELAVLDHLTGGNRLLAVVGIGYRPVEFELFGVDPRGRGKLLEEFVEVARSAWSGEPFDFRGTTVQVRPLPRTPGGPMLAVAGSTVIAAQRAARLRLPFFPSSSEPELYTAYREGCAAADYHDGWITHPAGPMFLHVTEDPERDWARIAPLALADATEMRSWRLPNVISQTDSNATTTEELRAEGNYVVTTPEAAVELLRDIEGFTLHPLMGGLDPDLAWESLELFADRVLPALRTT